MKAGGFRFLRGVGTGLRNRLSPKHGRRFFDELPGRLSRRGPRGGGRLSFAWGEALSATGKGQVAQPGIAQASGALLFCARSTCASRAPRAGIILLAAAPSFVRLSTRGGAVFIAAVNPIWRRGLLEGHHLRAGGRERRLIPARSACCVGGCDAHGFPI